MRVLTVQELTRHISSLIGKDYLLNNIWVKGEISNFKAASSGHLYFTLKDRHSCVKTVMFRSRSSKVLFRPSNGMAVIVRGYVSVFERDGVYQLYAEEMEPEGVGSLFIAFEQLKARLEQEGLFDVKYKKVLPLLPHRIGIVTSPTGAAVRDMMEIIRRRWPGLEIILAPVLVQGEGAPLSIVRGIQLLNKLDGIDLIIVGRGGGSLEELWAFNTEVVARSIFHSEIPVISAVGHETDFTIADFVADARAATPSAAAEMAVPDRKEMERYLRTLQERLAQAIDKKISTSRQRLYLCMINRYFTRPANNICSARQQLVDFLYHRLAQEAHGSVMRAGDQLAALTAQLNTLSPLATLARGYSICTTPDGVHVIRSAAELEPGDKLAVRLHQGSLQCIVEAKV
ncbi:MAG: exodeoxyribonuclease VII large subunit [Desulfotomaculaceae bacterium]|nr:exodeoxyribonuclease VII large subunit [Desulfotomaculaceae bacterium]